MRKPKPASKNALLWEFTYLQELLANPNCDNETLRHMVARVVVSALDPVRARREEAEREAEYQRTKPERDAALAACHARLNELLGEGWDKKSVPNA